MTDYAAYMTSDQWVSVREAALLRAQGECQRCHAWNCTLEVHHLTYDRLGHEASEDLQVLCHKCHEIADVERWGRDRYGEDLPPFDLLQIEYQGRRKRDRR